LQEGLDSLQKKSIDQLIETRFERLMAYGKFKETHPH
jgi:acetyl-CoA carboxylase carboxyl transferase subunit alpha